MDFLTLWYVWVLFFVAYFAMEFSLGLFFNYKIQFVSKGKYNWAALHGGIASFLIMISVLLAAFVAAYSGDDVSLSLKIGFLVWTTVATTIGNVASTLIMPKIQKVLENKKQTKKVVEE